MNLDILSPHRQEQYKRITEYKEDHPGVSDNAAERALGIPVNAMSAIRGILKNNGVTKPSRQKTVTEIKTKPRKPRMITLPVDQGPIETDKIIAFVGTTKSVIEAIREYQR